MIKWILYLIGLIILIALGKFVIAQGFINDLAYLLLIGIAMFGLFLIKYIRSEKHES